MLKDVQELFDLDYLHLHMAHKYTTAWLAYSVCFWIFRWMGWVEIYTIYGQLGSLSRFFTFFQIYVIYIEEMRSPFAHMRLG